MGALLKPFSTHCTRIPSVPTMDSQNVGFDITITSEEFKANSTSVFVTALSQLANVGVLIVLLVLVSLKHNTSFYSFITSVTLVRRVQVLVVRCARQVIDGVGQDGGFLVGSLFAFLSTT